MRPLPAAVVLSTVLLFSICGIAAAQDGAPSFAEEAVSSVGNFLATNIWGIIVALVGPTLFSILKQWATKGYLNWKLVIPLIFSNVKNILEVLQDEGYEVKPPGEPGQPKTLTKRPHTAEGFVDAADCIICCSSKLFTEEAAELSEVVETKALTVRRQLLDMEKAPANVPTTQS